MQEQTNPAGKTLILGEAWQQTLQLETDPRLFSPRQPDRGTLAMIGQVRLQPGDRLLDLGCGYGLVGLAAAKVLGPDQVVLVDVDPLAVDIARRNAIRNGLPGLRIIEGDGPAAAAPDQFGLILCNPPYHADFAVARRLIEQSRDRLHDGGWLYLVVKRLIWYQKKMAAVFGGVRVQVCDGYYLLASEKRAARSPQDSQNDAGAGHSPADGSATSVHATKTTRKHLKKMTASADRQKKHGRM